MALQGMTEADHWTAQLRKPGFLTEAVAAVQIAAMQQRVKLRAEPWQIAQALGAMMEEEHG